MKKENSVEINLESLTRVTPFVLAANDDTVVTWASRAVRKRVADAVGKHVSELIEWGNGSEGVSSESIVHQVGGPYKFGLLHRGPALPLIGWWLCVSSGFVLLATPEVRTDEDLLLFSFDDFPPHDHSVDLLVARDESRHSLVEAAHAAEVLKSANAALEREVAERQRVQEALRRSNQELEQFAYVASHDLQEPLRMVSSYVGLLAKRYRGKLDKDADEFIQYAVDGAERMRRLINDLLVYSRVGTRGKEFQPTECEEVLGQALLNLEVAIAESAAVITHDPLPKVRADEGQLVQLLQNLIGNAIKFRNSGVPAIHVSARSDTREWVFSVKDNGIGIDPQFSERIFGVFQRLHTQKEYPGSGIGLAVCKRIVERHGGRIWVESEVGKGATFFFTIPKQQEE